MQFQGTYKEEGGFNFGQSRERVLNHCKHNAGKRFTLSDHMPESYSQRKFYHGAVLPLWIYLDGKDYKDSNLRDSYHELAKIEFNAEMVVTKGRTVKIGKSTKHKLNEGFLEKVIENLEDQYGVKREECLDPKDYKHFKDKIFMESEFDDYIDYLKSLNRIPKLSTN